MNVAFLYQYPIWVTGLIFFAILQAALEFGFWIGRRRGRSDAVSAGSGDIALTAMYGLLGLVLAFTYSFAINRADVRKHATVFEANALSTAFLRADLAPEPGRTELRTQLRAYAGSRLVTSESLGTFGDIPSLIRQSLRLQSELWPTTARIVRNGSGGPIGASLVQSITDVLDAHTTRIAAVFDHLPPIILWMLVFIAGACVSVSGYNRGVEGKMNRFRMTALALVLAVVMTVITDFDRGLQGMVIVSQNSLEGVVADMDAALGGKTAR